MATLTIKDTAAVMLGANKEALEITAKLTAGNVLNDRLVKIVTPKLPLLLRAYASEPIGKAVLANAFSAALVHFGSTNDKLMIAADTMVLSAMAKFVSEFDLDGMANEFLDGVELPGFGNTSTTETK